jgi:transposase-like protein
MPKLYSAEFRRDVCERMLAGEAVLDLAKEFDIGFSTLYRWKRQALVDIGAAPGTKRIEADALALARRRIKDLENELTLVKAASELFEELSHDPKSSTRW